MCFPFFPCLLTKKSKLDNVKQVIEGKIYLFTWTCPQVASNVVLGVSNRVGVAVISSQIRSRVGAGPRLGEDPWAGAFGAGALGPSRPSSMHGFFLQKTLFFSF